MMEEAAMSKTEAAEAARTAAETKEETKEETAEETETVEVVYTEEARKRRTEEAAARKAEGNDLFGHGEWEAAYGKYMEAVATSPHDSRDLAVFKANAAACRIKQENYEDAVRLCTEALSVDAAYVKALQRRAQAHEKLPGLEHLSNALDDYKRVLELEPANAAAKAKVATLTPRVEEERQKQMQEMLGKVKDLGNMVLGKFGLSTDNFKMEKDPSTGSYSISFVK